MAEGGLDAVFFIVYVGQTFEEREADAFRADGYERAYQAANAKFEAIHRLTKEMAPGRIELALTAADVRRIAAAGRKVALIGVENGYPLGDNLARVKEFYDRGARYLSLAHNGHNQLSDSNTGERDGGYKWNGLSPLGRKVVAELNRLGIMVDVSHPSKASMMQAIDISKAPIIASHSSVRALADHPRNLDDEQLMAIKKNGGVVQLVALSDYLRVPKPDSPERAAAITALRKQLGLPEPPAGARRGGGSDVGQFTEAQRTAYRRRDGRGWQAVPGRSAGDGAAVRRSHRLRREDDRHRSRRHRVGLRRRRRDHGLERRVGDLQRHEGAGPARLHRGADCQDLERQPAPRDGTRRGGGEAPPEGRERLAPRHQPRTLAKISGATMVASDSMMNFGVSMPSLPQVIFSFGTAPE